MRFCLTDVRAGIGLIATFVTRDDDPQIGPVGSTTSQKPPAFMFDDLPTVAHCVTLQGDATPPMEGRAVLLVSESSDRFYEQN